MFLAPPFVFIRKREKYDEFLPLDGATDRGRTGTVFLKIDNTDNILSSQILYTF